VQTERTASSSVLGINAETNTSAGHIILAAAVVLGFAGDLLLRAWPWGLNVTIWIAGMCAVAVALPRFESLALPRRGGTVWIWIALGFSLMLAWRSSPVLQALNLVAVFLCLGVVALPTTATALRKARGTEFAVGLAVSAIQLLIGMAVLLWRHVDWRAATNAERSAGFAALGRGLAIAVVPTLIFGGLFASADVFFRDLLTDVIVVDPDVVVSHVFLWAFFAWLAGSYLWGALLSGRQPVPEPRRIEWLRFEFIETGVVFGLINVLFLAFVAVQFRYLFGGADHVESSSSLTYAEYARRGFFELAAVAALVVPFLLFTHWLLPRARPRLHRFYAAVAFVLVLLVFVVIASALERMRLYQRVYGLTELRLYTTAFIVWLVAVFAWLSFTVLRGRPELFAFGSFLVGIVVLVGLNVLNPDALIVRRNTDIAHGGRAFDSAYALQLSADSVPALVEHFDSVKPDERCAVARELRSRYLDADDDWRTWNWGRSRAQDAVEASDELATACDDRRDS
jgi:hypothetical protein